MSALNQSRISVTYQTFGDFAACDRACAILAAAGFSVGHMQRGAPCGILFGNFDIQKWRNLSLEERYALHGFMTGDMRNGPVTVEIFDTAPEDAKAAFDATLMRIAS